MILASLSVALLVLFLSSCQYPFHPPLPANKPPTPPPRPPGPPSHSFNISRAYVISLYTDTLAPHELAASIRHYLHIQDTRVFPAINGTSAIESGGLDQLTLYTRYLMLAGRHDHMQLSNPSMLGCLLSHVSLWKSIRPNETIAVFEEDAYLDMASAERMHTLSQDMRAVPAWDVLLLESGHSLIASGQWENVGTLAATCSQNQSLHQPPCTWFGTRGYLMTHSGAQQLLEHVLPISVQVDALIGLVAAFSPGFTMYWTRQNIAHLKLLHVTGVWDACFKCYLPTSPYLYVLLILAVVAYVFASMRAFTIRLVLHWRQGNK